MKKETKLFIVFLTTFVLLNVIGYVFNVEVLKTVLRTEGKLELHFIPLLSGLVLSVLASLIIKE